MIVLLLDSTLRSLLLAVAVWTALRIFRVRSVPAEKAAWLLVLAAAVLMPLLAPIAAHVPRIPALTIPAAPVTQRTPALSPGIPSTTIFQEKSVSDSSLALSGASHYPAPTISKDTGAAERWPPSAQPSPQLNIAPGVAIVVYLTIASALLFRLFFGLVATLRLWMNAEPICLAASKRADGLRVRSSSSIACPVTIGSGVLLPREFVDWDAEKLRIVLAHERAHVRHGDFYLQLLAGLYAAIFWVSPLGWWLKHKLSDLAEAISDHSGLEEAASRASYAKVLLEFAAAPRPTLIGVAMARSSNFSHRIDRLFNERAFRQAFVANRRALVTTVIVTATLFAATTLLRVEAASQVPQTSQTESTQAPVTAPSHPQVAPPAAPMQAEPVTPPSMPEAPLAPSSTPPALPVPPTKPVPPVAPAHPVPSVHVDVPAIHVNVPARHIEVPAIHVNVPATHVDVPAQHIDVPETHVDVPAQHIDVPAQKFDMPAVNVDVPAIHIDLPADHSSYGSTGQMLSMLTGWGHALFQAAAAAPVQATFDRALTFSGKADLKIGNGSGNIHLIRGNAGQVKIHATVSSKSQEDAEQVRSLAANPPIMQEGNSIRIGDTQHHPGTNHIRIDYEIQAPADSALTAATGSGNITDEGVGLDSKLATGSGNIAAMGLDGDFKVESGSGNISVESAGKGDAKVETGSGTVVVKNVRGALKAETGSGTIQVSGTPTSPWKLETGSGDIELTVGNAPMNLDASTGSGKISTAQGMALQASSDRHHLRGAINGGGPEVKVETGSGNISIH